MARNKHYANTQPAFNVYTVQDRGDKQEPFWLKIGACFEHKDGDGYNLTLQALPIDNRLVLRVPKDKDDD